MAGNRRFETDELIGAAALIVGLGGLLAPYVASDDMKRAIVIWLVMGIAAGITLGRPDQTGDRSQLDGNALGLGALFVLVIGFYHAFAWLWADVQSNRLRFEVPEGAPSTLIEFFDTYIKVILLYLGVMLATWVLISLTAWGSGPILLFARRTWTFGPAGLTRLRAFVVALAALVSLLVAYWDKLF